MDSFSAYLREYCTKAIYDVPDKIVGIEKVESRRFIGNYSIRSDTNSTDVWFHIVDPLTGRLLERKHPAVEQ